MCPVLKSLSEAVVGESEQITDFIISEIKKGNKVTVSNLWRCTTAPLYIGKIQS